MSSQHYSFVSLCLIVVFITSQGVGVDCRPRPRQPVRNGTLDEDEQELFEQVVAATSTSVHTTAGIFTGKLYRGYNYEYYTSFADIPYARPPVGELRYKKPQPLDTSVDEFIDVSKSIEYEEIVTRCKQYIRWDGHSVNAEDRIVGEENCLYLDIIRPAGTEVEHKARLEQDVLGKSAYAHVMVFLHPGTFMYDIPMNHYQMTEYFCCNFMLFVFVRFRLGPLGFANLGPLSDEIVPNLGLWDQVVALKWVQRHIAAFGGDEKKVTLTGVAAGAACVNYHMLSSVSKGLFNKAISVGGSALNPWAFARHSVNHTLTLIHALGCEASTEEGYSDCLMNVDADDIVQQSAKLYAFQNLPINPLGPVVDGEFLHAEPDILMRANHTLAVPWLVSFSSDYTLYPNFDFVEDIHNEYSHEKWFEVAPHIMGLKDRVADEIMNEVTWDIREYYLNSKDSNFTNLEWYHKVGRNTTLHDDPLATWDSRDKINQMASDSMYTIGIVEAARLHALSLESKYYAKHGKQVNHYEEDLAQPQGLKVYLYKFGYRSNRVTDFLASPVQRWAKAHRDEFSLLTGNIDDVDDEVLTPEEIAQYQHEAVLQSLLVGLWGSFIKDGVPYQPITYKKDYYYQHVRHKIEGPLDVAYTILLNAPLYRLPLHSDNLGEMRFWRKMPLQMYEEYDDYAELPDDDGVYVPLFN